MKRIVAMQKPVEHEKSACQPVNKPLLARYGRQWAAGTCLATGAAIAAAVVGLTTTPTAHADDGTGVVVPIDEGAAQAAAESIVAKINSIPGVNPISVPSQVTVVQDHIQDEILGGRGFVSAQTTAQSDPTVANIADLLVLDAQLNAVNSAVDYGNATYISQALPAVAAGEFDSNEADVVGTQVPFENDIIKFYQSLPDALVHPQDETNPTLVKLMTYALDYQNLANDEVGNKSYGLGSINDIGDSNLAGITEDNLYLGNYDTDLYNYTGWLTEWVGLDNVL